MPHPTFTKRLRRHGHTRNQEETTMRFPPAATLQTTRPRDNKESAQNAIVSSSLTSSSSPVSVASTRTAEEWILSGGIWRKQKIVVAVASEEQREPSRSSPTNDPSLLREEEESRHASSPPPASSSYHQQQQQQSTESSLNSMSPPRSLETTPRMVPRRRRVLAKHALSSSTTTPPTDPPTDQEASPVRPRRLRASLPTPVRLLRDDHVDDEEPDEVTAPSPESLPSDEDDMDEEEVQDEWEEDWEKEVQNGEPVTAQEVQEPLETSAMTVTTVLENSMDEFAMVPCLPLELLASVTAAYGPEACLYKDVLHVSKLADDRQIRIAYFRRGRQVLAHADESVAKERFRAVSAAFEVLSKPEWKHLYDASIRQEQGQEVVPPPSMAAAGFPYGDEVVAATAVPTTSLTIEEEQDAPDPTTEYESDNEEQELEEKQEEFQEQDSTPPIAKPLRAIPTRLPPAPRPPSPPAPPPTLETPAPPVSRFARSFEEDLSYDLSSFSTLSQDVVKSTPAAAASWKPKSCLANPSATMQKKERRGIRWNEHVEELVYQETFEDDDEDDEMSSSQVSFSQQADIKEAPTEPRRKRKSRRKVVVVEALGERLHTSETRAADFLDDLEDSLDGLEAKFDALVIGDMIAEEPSDGEGEPPKEWGFPSGHAGSAANGGDNDDDSALAHELFANLTKPPAQAVVDQFGFATKKKAPSSTADEHNTPTTKTMDLFEAAAFDDPFADLSDTSFFEDSFFKENNSKASAGAGTGAAPTKTKTTNTVDPTNMVVKAKSRRRREQATAPFTIPTQSPSRSATTEPTTRGEAAAAGLDVSYSNSILDLDDDILPSRGYPLEHVPEEPSTGASVENNKSKQGRSTPSSLLPYKPEFTMGSAPSSPPGVYGGMPLGPNERLLGHPQPGILTIERTRSGMSSLTGYDIGSVTTNEIEMGGHPNHANHHHRNSSMTTLCAGLVSPKSLTGPSAKSSSLQGQSSSCSTETSMFATFASCMESLQQNVTKMNQVVMESMTIPEDGVQGMLNVIEHELSRPTVSRTETY